MADPGRPSGPPRGSSDPNKGVSSKREDSPLRSTPAATGGPSQGSIHPRPSTAQRETASQQLSSSPSASSGFPPARPRAPSQLSSSSGRGPAGGLPASSSYPELVRDSPSRRTTDDFPPVRPRAPTMESLASGIGSLTTLPAGSSPASGSSTQPSRPRAPTLGSRASGSPTTPARVLLGSQASIPTGSKIQTSEMVYKTFRVVQALSAGDAEALNLRHGSGGFVSLQVGDFGAIPNIPENVVEGNKLSAYPQVQLLREGVAQPEPRPNMPLGNGRCRVPKTNIEIGTFVRKDVWLIDEANFANPTLKMQLSQNTSPLQKFLESFLASMSQAETQKQLKLHGVPDAVTDIVLQAGRCRAFVKELMAGMHHCGTLDLFKQGIPKLGELWNKLRQVNSVASNAPFSRDGNYFYLLMYHNEKTNDTGLYIGRTVDTLSRSTQHSRCLSGNESLVHYQMGRKKIANGAKHRFFPIAFLPKTMTNLNLFRAWAETILTVLFDSFNPVMLNIKNPAASGQLTPDEVAQLGKTLQQDAYLQTCGAPLAKLLQTVASHIKNADPSLSGFVAKEPFTGLNWSVPIAELVMKEANLWVRTTTQGNANKPAMWTFRTHPRRVTASKRLGIFYGDERNTQPVKFRPIIPLEGTGLGPGSVVNVVVEITIDPDKKHPYAYARMPTVGPFDCWNEAFRLAIRIEYEDDQGWKTRYLKQDYVTIFSSKVKSMSPSDLGEELNHIELGWVHAMKMLAALLNWRWQPADSPLAKRVWVPYINRLRVIDFDFFNQRLVVGDCQPVNKPCPRLLTLDETSQLIEEKFGYDVHIGSLPNLALINTPSRGFRSKCDLCLMGQRGTHALGLARKCKDRRVVRTVNGINLVQCPFSAALRRYCTFTLNIENRRDLHDLVYLVEGDKTYPVQSTMTPPNVFQYLEVREKLEEEPVEEDDD